MNTLLDIFSDFQAKLMHISDDLPLLFIGQYILFVKTDKLSFFLTDTQYP